MVNQYNKLIKFHGDGGNLFSVYIVNMILTILTLGLYYPWARAALLRYTYQETEFAGSRFTFHGTGNEMFMGMLKGIGIFASLYFIVYLAALSQNFVFAILAVLLFYVGLIAIIPIAIHGAMRYRMSRTSWRGIHFSYQGKLGELMSEFFAGITLSILTLGIYNSWRIIYLRSYVIDKIRFGNLQFSYVGNGADFFFINLKGYFLTMFTLGIYYFWWMKDSFDYYVNNIQIMQGDKVITFRSDMSGSKYLSLMLVNVLMLVFTLGIASPWVTVRTLRYVFSCINIDDELNPDTIEQDLESYETMKNNDMADILDIGIA